MKKALKIFGGLILFILLLMILVPYLYKDKLIELVKTEANKNLNATLDFGDVDLTFFAHFPNLTLKIEDLTLTGKDEFEGIQLINIHSFNLVIGLGKVLKGNEIPDINKVYIEDPIVTAIVLKNGRVNWDIVKKEVDNGNENTGGTDTSKPTDINVNLRYYEIKNAQINYTDNLSDMVLVIDGLNHSGSGNFGLDGLSLSTKTHIENIMFQMDKTRYIDNFSIDAALNFGVGLDLMRFTITKGDIFLNKFELQTTGYFEMPGDDIKMDIKFNSPSTGLKQLMALAPEEYTGDLDEYKFTGKVSFNGWLKGVYNDIQIPLFGVNLSVNDGSFHYAELPKSAENIEIRTDINLKNSKDMNSLVVDVSQFDMDLGGNPIRASLYLVNPMTSMDVKSTMKANIDLASLKDVLPIEKKDELQGKIESDLNFEGSLEAAGNENYDKLRANGFVKMNDFIYRSPAFTQPVYIDNTELQFNLDKAELKSFHAKIGKSDFNATGQLVGFLPYTLMDKELKGSLTYHSDYLDLNELIDLMQPETGESKSTLASNSTKVNTVPKTKVKTEELETENKTVVKVEKKTSDNPPSINKSSSKTKTNVVSNENVVPEELLLPENVNFVLYADISKIKYQEINMTSFKGLMRFKKGRLILEKCRLNTLGGNVVLNGSFDELKKDVFKISFDFKMKNLNIKQTAGKIEMVKKYAPMAQYTQGTFSTDLIYRSLLDKDFGPKYNTVYSKGRLRTHNVKIEGYKPLDTFAQITKTGDIVHQQFDDLDIDYEIIDGKAFIKPFNFKLDKLTGSSSGTIDLEQNVDFLVHLKIPTEMLGQDANQLMGQFAGALAGFGLKVDVPENIEMDVAISGKVDNPNFKPSISGLSSDNAKKAIEKKVGEELEKAKEEAKKRASAEADKILRDAQKQADELMKNARAEVKKLKAEGYKQADDLVKNSSGMLEKIAAQAASDELKKQIDKQAENVLKEAQNQANKILEDAQKQANKLK